MAVDYDLVVIGNTQEGIYAARTAAALQARVALVTQSDTEQSDRDIINSGISEIARWNFIRANHPFDFKSDLFEPITLTAARDWAMEVESGIEAQNSLSQLAAIGVDVILGKGEFVRLPKLAFNTPKRQLRSRYFLLATGAKFTLEFPDRFEINNFLTPDDLWQLNNLENLPERLVIIGNFPQSLELAQTLTRFGKNLTLVIEQQRLLPLEDLEISQLIQAHLEAEGIKILTNSAVSQIKEIDNKKWLQIGDRAIETDEIIFANYRQPEIANLNLAGVNVKYNNQRVVVNSKLQTTNSQIYACGDLIGGYSLPNIALSEANIVLKNTLFIPKFSINYHYLPWGILTQPNLARVGLTETQAKEQYDEEIYIVKQYFKNIARSQIMGETTGLCKSILTPDGIILGCTIVGDRATELISTIAVMMKHKIELTDNLMQGMTTTELPYIYPSCAEILHKIAADFHRQKLQKSDRWQNWLETWFNLRRDWHK
jgi:pyruvate/2-oxoglutarate dehydrogenase complex dihydrolipoamide dehydrogenase (E3) component